jgi:hypothetical protein
VAFQSTLTSSLVIHWINDAGDVLVNLARELDGLRQYSAYVHVPFTDASESVQLKAQTDGEATSLYEVYLDFYIVSRARSDSNADTVHRPRTGSHIQCVLQSWNPYLISRFGSTCTRSS